MSSNYRWHYGRNTIGDGFHAVFSYYYKQLFDMTTGEYVSPEIKIEYLEYQESSQFISPYDIQKYTGGKS